MQVVGSLTTEFSAQHFSCICICNLHPKLASISSVLLVHVQGCLCLLMDRRFPSNPVVSGRPGTTGSFAHTMDAEHQ